MRPLQYFNANRCNNRSTGRISAVYVDHHSDSRHPELVANSLAEFLSVYERNPEVVHAW